MTDAAELIERMDYAENVVAKDPVASDLGIELERLEKERALVSLVPRARHLNGMGRVHGTTYYALVDQAMAIAANTISGTALVYECKVNFLAATAPGEKLLAEATPLSRGRKLRLWEIKVSNENGDLKALAQGVTYHRGPEKDSTNT